MKRKIISVLMGVCAIALLGHGNTITGDTVKAYSTVSSMINCSCLNMADMDTVTGYKGTVNSLQLYTEDGTGYCLKAENIQNGNTQLYYTLTQKDFDALAPILENRNGKIITQTSHTDWCAEH